ncbi:uncharacterized protein V6R79_001480 [Siganus canaliculatus]
MICKPRHSSRKKKAQVRVIRAGQTSNRKHKEMHQARQKHDKTVFSCTVTTDRELAPNATRLHLCTSVVLNFLATFAGTHTPTCLCRAQSQSRRVLPPTRVIVASFTRGGGETDATFHVLERTLRRSGAQRTDVKEQSMSTEADGATFCLQHRGSSSVTAPAANKMLRHQTETNVRCCFAVK